MSNTTNQDKKLEELLTAWEETYKKGQLTLWILLSLQESKKYSDEIKTFVEEKSQNTMSCEDQSLYRALRKFEHVGVLDFELRKGNKGPERKYYFITVLGQKLFDQFVGRNINLFYSPEIKNYLNL
ncbi:Transcriptional regulator PadR-like family protein [compost metagenome]|jgi:PadR family transcriptional regulator PadR|uniref:PadR family transcriptional regulator n=1 Tax=Sphingobacterium faecium TaxID=34087 RepID=UPI000F98B728